MNNTIPTLIKELLDKKHSVKLTAIDYKSPRFQTQADELNPYGYILENFGYKESGFVTLIPCSDNSGIYYVVGRYGYLQTVETYDDLVLLNHSLWCTYHNRYNQNEWLRPEEAWIADMLRLELIREKVETTYVPR